MKPRYVLALVLALMLCGIMASTQTSAHAHAVTLDPSGRYALVPDLGAYRDARPTLALAPSSLVAIDARWDDRETWAAIHRSAGPVTDFYLLAALDKRSARLGAGRTSERLLHFLEFVGGWPGAVLEFERLIPLLVEAGHEVIVPSDRKSVV